MPVAARRIAGPGGITASDYMLGFLPEPLRSPFTLFANLFNSRGSRGPVALPTATVALVMMDNREPNLKRWLEQHGETEELSLDAQARLVLIFGLRTQRRTKSRPQQLLWRVRCIGCRARRSRIFIVKRQAR